MHPFPDGGAPPSGPATNVSESPPFNVFFFLHDCDICKLGGQWPNRSAGHKARKSNNALYTICTHDPLEICFLAAAARVVGHLHRVVVNGGVCDLIDCSLHASYFVSKSMVGSIHCQVLPCNKGLSALCCSCTIFSAQYFMKTSYFAYLSHRRSTNQSINQSVNRSLYSN